MAHRSPVLERHQLLRPDDRPDARSAARRALCLAWPVTWRDGVRDGCRFEALSAGPAGVPVLLTVTVGWPEGLDADAAGACGRGTPPGGHGPRGDGATRPGPGGP